MRTHIWLPASRSKFFSIVSTFGCVISEDCLVNHRDDNLMIPFCTLSGVYMLSDGSYTLVITGGVRCAVFACLGF